MDTWGCCKTIMMGYVAISPKLLFVHMEINYIMLDYDFDPELCLCVRLLGRVQFKPWGVKKNHVPYMTEIVLTNALV